MKKVVIIQFLLLFCINIFCQRQYEVIYNQTDDEENETAQYSFMNRWTITVRNLQTGNTTLSKEVNDSICRLNTSSWPSGVYVITANDDTETVSTKIVVK